MGDHARVTTGRLAAADRRFLQAFERCDIAAAAFHHPEHLRLAYIYLSLHPTAAALETMRSGLQRLLAHLGAPASKYHETLTAAWLLAVNHFMQMTGPTGSFDQFAGRAGRLFDQRIMQTHYTRELLFSDAARTGFVEPDLQPIPRYSAVA
jgi:hypothetical protein